MFRKDSSVRLGSRMTSTQLVAFMGHVFHANFVAEARGLPKTPLCIWGTHGIGKTETVESVAQNNGWKWAYVAPAQFEEMGDFLGMPKVDEHGCTVFAPPEWVPREEGPGILLIDRAASTHGAQPGSAQCGGVHPVRGDLPAVATPRPGTWGPTGSHGDGRDHPAIRRVS